MNVCHTIFHHSSNLLQTFEVTHCADRIALYEDIASCQQLQGLQGSALRSQHTLPSLDETLMILESVFPLRSTSLDPRMSKGGEILLAPGKGPAIELQHCEQIQKKTDGTYLLVSHLVANFDDIGRDTIFKDFDSLRSLYKKLYCKQGVLQYVERFLRGHCGLGA